MFYFSLFIFYFDHIKPLNAELNPICYLLALLGAHHILHVSRIRVKVAFTRHHSIYRHPLLLNRVVKTTYLQ